MEQQHPTRKRKKRAGAGNRAVFLLVGAVLLLYVIAQIVSAFSGVPQTVPAAHVTVNDSFASTGWFFRDELPVTGSSSDTVEHIVYSGERVQQNAALAIVYSDEQSLELNRSLEALDNQIALLNTALQSAGDGSDAAKLDQLITLSLQQLSAQLKTGSGAALSSTAASLHTLSLRRNAATLDSAAIAAEKESLTAQRNSLSQQLAGRSQQITAASSGYFSEIVDGYEGRLTLDALSGLTTERFHELTETPPTAAVNTLGKIVEGFHWYLVAEVAAEQAARVTEGQSLRVSFTQASIETPVKVQSILKERNSDVALLVLEGDEFNSELVSMRSQPIDIIVGTYTGLKVPKQAARMMENEDGDSRLGVFILSGSVTKFKNITPLFETDTYYVVQQSATDASALVAQDQIVVKGKNLQNNMVVRT